jgi:hypothetical protein
VGDLFVGEQFSQEDRDRPMMPSINANYSATRNGLGMYGQLVGVGELDKNDYDLQGLIKQPKFFDGLLPDDPNASEEDRIRDFYNRLVFKADFSEPSFVAILRDMLPDDLKKRCPSVCDIAVDDEGIERLLSDEYLRVREGVANHIQRMMDSPGGVERRVQLVGLPEALKIRVISKGPGDIYFFLKPLQKFMARVLRKFSVLRLTGEAVTSDYVREQMEKGNGDLFASLDYSAATDGLDPEISAAIVDAISDNIGLDLFSRKCFHFALTGHMVDVPLETDEELLKGDVCRPQVWGQLMGSVVSFVVLCIANLTVMRLAFELRNEKMDGGKVVYDQSKISLEKLPMCVNGDDGLMRCNRAQYQLWSVIADSVGLKPSVGKVYLDSNYMNINSASFLWNGGRVDSISYVNMGLASGLSRSGEPRSSDAGLAISNIGAQHRDLIHSCPVGIRESVHSFFVQKNKDLLNMFKLPWFVPQNYGGLGLTPLCYKQSSISKTVDGRVFNDVDIVYSNGPLGLSKRVGPSDLDLMCCRLLANKLVDKGERIKPLGRDMKVVARQVWTKFLTNLNGCRKLNIVGEPNEYLKILMDQQDDLFPKLDLLTLYLLPKSCIQAQQVSMRALRNNERVWCGSLCRKGLQYMNVGKLPPFLYVEDTHSLTLMNIRPKSSLLQ